MLYSVTHSVQDVDDVQADDVQADDFQDDQNVMFMMMFDVRFKMMFNEMMFNVT